MDADFGWLRHIPNCMTSVIYLPLWYHVMLTLKMIEELLTVA